MDSIIHYDTEDAVNALAQLAERTSKSIVFTLADRYEFVNSELHHGFKMIIQNLNVGDENKGGILEFKKFNDELDKFRNEKIEDIIPEFKEIYEWAES
jgi:hypothetical protein